MIEFSEFNRISQNAHLLAGALLIIGTAFLLGFTASIYAFGLGVVLAAWKEFYYDEKYETAEVRGSSLEDFIFYGVGMIVGLGIVAAKNYL